MAPPSAAAFVAAALLALAVPAAGGSIDYGPTYGQDYAGEDYNVTQWHSPPSLNASHWKAAALECEALCAADAQCCTWTYVTPEGGSSDPERCCLKNGMPKEVSSATHWTGAIKGRAGVGQCAGGDPPYPGPVYSVPKIHNSPNCLHMPGWHDIAAALTFKGTHHVMQGCPNDNGWHHAASTDLVHWEDRGIHVIALNETWGISPPCSGFLTVDDDGTPCAGFRQCGSSHGLPGGHPWDVPLELRCAQNANLTQWGDPEYIFDFYFNRALPYDPVRPWVDADGKWYATISADGCNGTKTPCDVGGREYLFTSPKLHGDGADWQPLGPMFTSNRTVLDAYQPSCVENAEFVTAGYFGALPGDPAGGATRVFTNNVAGDGCGSGTTAYFVGKQSNGGPLTVDYSDPNAMGMIDWGAFAPNGKGPGAAGLDGGKPRGLSMARTLGSDPNQVAKAGRKVIIGWSGGTPAAQTLARDLSFDANGALLQAFVPELKVLRQPPSHVNVHGASTAAPLALTGGQQLEVAATFTVAAGTTSGRMGVSVLGTGSGSGDTATLVGVDLGAEQVFLADRAGPLMSPPGIANSAWTPDAARTVWLHVIVDHSIVEVIVNNRTALTIVSANVASAEATVASLFVPEGVSVEADSWALDSI